MSPETFRREDNLEIFDITREIDYFLEALQTVEEKGSQNLSDEEIKWLQGGLSFTNKVQLQGQEVIKIGKISPKWQYCSLAFHAWQEMGIPIPQTPKDLESLCKKYSGSINSLINGQEPDEKKDTSVEDLQRFFNSLYLESDKRAWEEYPPLDF